MMIRATEHSLSFTYAVLNVMISLALAFKLECVWDSIFASEQILELLRFQGWYSLVLTYKCFV